MFALFYDETGTIGYKGIIQNEEANQVSVSSIPKRLNVSLIFSVIWMLIPSIAKITANTGNGFPNVMKTATM